MHFELHQGDNSQIKRRAIHSFGKSSQLIVSNGKPESRVFFFQLNHKTTGELFFMEALASRVVQI